MPFCNKINQSIFKVEVVIICWELDTHIRNSDVFTFLPTCPVARNTVTWPAKKVTLKLLYNLIAFGPIKWHSIRQRLFGCVAPYAAKVASPAFLHPRFFLSFPLREKPFSEIREKHYQMKTVKVVSALSPTLSLSLSHNVLPFLLSLSISSFSMQVLFLVFLDIFSCCSSAVTDSALLSFYPPFNMATFFFIFSLFLLFQSYFLTNVLFLDHVFSFLSPHISFLCTCPFFFRMLAFFIFLSLFLCFSHRKHLTVIQHNLIISIFYF